MVQLVFVHGVATRAGVPYDQGVALRDRLFREGAFAGRSVDIENPFWGDSAGSLAFGQASLPRGGQQVASFGLLSAAAGEADAPSIASTAARDFGAAVDMLYAVMVEEAAADGRQIESDEFAEFRAAGAYAEATPRPVWVRADMTDDEFVDRLRASMAAASPASYGFLDRVKEAAGVVLDRGRNLVAQGLVALVRDDLNPRVAEFLGDIFVYMRQGARRDAIRSRIADAIGRAHARAVAGGGPLVLVGHSLGGVILYDMLSDPAGAGLPRDLSVDLLLTVGSQPGFFEEMKLFAASDPAVGPHGQVKLATAPPRVARWWNVYDPVDVLAFRCAGIFEGVEDFAFNSVAGVADTHGSYFARPRFHERLRARLANP